MTCWMYRVLELDDDGDPLDWGVVQAHDLHAAQVLVRTHLLAIFETDYEALDVAFYPAVVPDGPSVWLSDNRITTTINLEAR